MSTATTPRASPRISVNKLGEYLVATAGRRRRIVYEQKMPREFQVARYTEAKDAIAAFLASGATDESIIITAIAKLIASEPKSDWDAQRIDLCAEALGSILDFEAFDFLAGMKAEIGPSEPPKLNIAGVAVSVRPEVLLHGTDRLGAPIRGGIKLHLGKTVPLEEESALYVATLLHRFLSDAMPGEGRPALGKCAVLDVFARKAFFAPRSYTRRRRDIDAACEEISRAWGAV
jgi:hypothetical protein